MSLLEVSRRLSRRVERLAFAHPVTHTYNPLRYARQPHEAYLTRFGSTPRAVLLVGMNPGPFGMAQTGVPFGDVSFVRDWMGIVGAVSQPKLQHPKRVIEGFNCPRKEVSGSRLWGWARDRFNTPGRFFEQFFVANYCPLIFLEDSGRNRTPDKLSAAERAALYEPCDEALCATIEWLRPQLVVGVGGFAHRRIQAIVKAPPRQMPAFDDAVILHPSPANPHANRGWSTRIEEQLMAAGVRLPPDV